MSKHRSNRLLLSTKLLRTDLVCGLSVDNESQKREESVGRTSLSRGARVFFDGNVLIAFF